MCGVFWGDCFVFGSLGLIIVVITIFVFVLVFIILIRVVEDENGQFAWSLFQTNVFSSKVWGAGGVVWNFLGLVIAMGLTMILFGLVFVLLVVRTCFLGKKWLCALIVLSIITFFFVIGFVFILVFGRAGFVIGLLEQWFGIPFFRYIFGFWGIFIVQVLVFIFIVFLVLVASIEVTSRMRFGLQ